MAVQFPCVICYKEVLQDAVECEMCMKWVHRKCARLSKKQLRDLMTDHFECAHCQSEFPFSGIGDDELVHLSNFENDAVNNINTSGCTQTALPQGQANIFEPHGKLRVNVICSCKYMYM